MISRDTSSPDAMPADPDAPEDDRRVWLRETAARLIAEHWRKEALREHPAPGRTLH